MKVNTIKILHILKSLPIGGAEVLLLNSCVKLKDLGYEVNICSLTDKGVLGFEFEKMGIPVFTLKSNPHVFNIFTIIHLSRLIKKISPQIVQTHIYPSNTLGRIAAFIARVPIIIATEHGLYRWKKGRQILIDRALAHMTDKIVVVSNASKKHIHKRSKIPSDKLVTLYNFVEPDRFQHKQDRHDVKRKIGLKANDIVLGSVGRIVKEKGYGCLLRAFKQIAKGDKTVKLILIGDGPFLKTLKRKVFQYELEKHVFLPGYRRDIPDLLNIMDIFIFPTLEEGFGISILEAFLYKLPVIASNVDAIPEIIEDGLNGLLVSPNDEKELATAINKLLMDKTYSTRLGEKGYEIVHTRFIADIQVIKIDEFYKSLLRLKSIDFEFQE